MARPITLFTIQWGDLSLEEVCKLAKQMGFEGLELSAAHIDMRKAAVDKAYVEEVKATLKKYDLGCWAMSHHLAGQCVCDTLPDAYDSRLDGFAPAELAGKPELIQKWGIEEMMATAHAAQNMGVKVVTFFMGSPIWKFWYSFPQTSEEQVEAAYQKVKELWTPIFDEFDKCGVKLALEIHPTEIAFDYWSTKKLLETFEYRPTLGINFDPSHLIWQGMDPVAALRELKGAVYHFHAKDTKVDPYNKARNGVLDTGSYGNLLDRSWVFRTIGYGSDMKMWKDLISTLRMIGYDGAVSIEHEDGLMSVREGLEKAISFLKEVIINEQPAAMWWA